MQNWDFASDTSLDWQKARNNDFTGDSLRFGDAGGTLSTDWNVITSGSDDIFTGLADAADVTLFGEIASLSGSDWVSDNFTLRLDSDNHSLVIAARV